MKIREIYNSTDINKTIVESKTEWDVTTIYYWTARYPRLSDPSDTWYRWPSDENKPIWRIRRMKYDASTWEYDYSYPDWDVNFSYKWSDRTTLNYDVQPEPPVPPTPWVDNAFLLENWSVLITENWSYIIIESA